MRRTHVRARRTTRKRLSAPQPDGGLAKNAHVCVLIQHAEYPSKTTTQLPGKTPSAGGRLLHPARLKRKRTAFFRPTRPLSRPRRRANSPSATPDVAQTQIDPARAPHLAALERGRLATQKTRSRNLQRAVRCYDRRQARSPTGVQSPGPTPQASATAPRPLAADVAVGHGHSDRVTGQDARVMTKGHGCLSATPICE